MKKQLCVLLLIFMATVGVSSVVSAVPLTQETTQGPTTINPVIPGCHWVIFNRFIVPCSPQVIFSLSSIYRPPIDKILIVCLDHNRCIVTIWRMVCFPPIPTLYKK